jgi:hypothetical protein
MAQKAGWADIADELNGQADEKARDETRDDRCMIGIR